MTMLPSYLTNRQWPSAPVRVCIVVGLTAVALAIFAPNAMAQEERISERRLREATAFLGSDSLEGRGTGTRGVERAAHYIASQLRDAGIAPAGADGGYFQSIPMHGSIPLEDSRFVLRARDKNDTLRLWKDYVLYKTGAGTFIPTLLPLVFVGYGIIAPEYGFDDYRNIDVNNAVVVFLDGEPPSDDREYFDSHIPTHHSYAERKQQIALSRGARGSIMLPLPRLHDSAWSWKSTVQDFAFEHVTLLYGVPENLAALVTERVAERLFAHADYSYQDVLEWDAARSMRSFRMETAGSFHGHFMQRDFVDRNVAGIISGSDPEFADSYLLLSAHYDHLGIGPPVDGDSIYNGVGDNAIGVAALLEIARALKANPPKRSVLLLFVSGEEKGLLGSRYYCDNPIVPLHQTIANINIDGIAMFDRFREVVGIGAELSSIATHLTDAASSMGLAVSGLPPQFMQYNVFERSDQLAFAAAGIPSVLVMDGLASETLSRDETLSRFASWGRDIYHTPFDDLQQQIDFKAASLHTAFLLHFAETLANTPAPPEWKHDVPYRNIRLKTISEDR